MLGLDLKAQIQGLISVQNFIDAHALSKKLCEQNPDDPEAQFLHGAICGQIGDYAASEKALLVAYSQAPNNPQLNYNLAVAFFEQKKFEQAIEYASRVVQLEPSNYHAWLYLGGACEAADQLDNAGRSYVQAIQIQPETDDAYRSLGALYMKLQQWQPAAEIFNKLLEMGFSDEKVINNFGVVLTKAYQFEKLITVFEPLAVQRPSDVVLNYYVAMAYLELGEIEIAEKYFETVLAENAEHLESIASLAGIYKFKGETGKSMEMIEPLVNSHPEHPAVVLVFAAIAPNFDRIDDAIKLLANLLETKNITGQTTEAKALVALGVLYEKKKDYKRGFEYFQRGNKSHSPEFNREQLIKNIEDLEQLYSADNINLLPVSNSTSNTPIFILGMPRSGTSLVEQILASHSEVFGAGELKYIQNYTFELSAQQINGKSYPDCLADVSQLELQRLSDDYLEQLNVLSSGSARVTDKMPGNFMFLGLIYQLFPNAKVLHCVRDPMDTCVSCYSKFFSGAHQYSYDLDDLGFYYRSYERLMKLWKQNLPIQIFDVNYEELVNDKEKFVKEILEYCELPWQNSCLDFHNTVRSVATASTDQVRKPMYTSSIGKWRHYEQFVAPLTEALEKYK